MPTRESHSEGTPSWVDLATTDPAGAREFYEALFGWSFEANALDGGGEYIMATKDGRSAAGVFQQPQEQLDMGLPPLWNTYITVDDVDATTGSVEGAGGQVMAAPFDVMDAGRMAVIADPSGAVVCLWQPRAGIGAEVVNEPGAYVWAELQTGDQDAAAGFFSKLLGWDSGTVEMEGVGAMTMFKRAGEDVASAMNLPAEGVPPHWQVYFGVDDCDAACETAAAKGGSVLMGPIDAPPGRMAAIADPAGAVFSVIALAQPPS